MCVFKYMYIHKCGIEKGNLYVHPHIEICVYIDICMHVFIHECSTAGERVVCTSERAHACILIYIYNYMYKHECSTGGARGVYTYIYICIYIYIYVGKRDTPQVVGLCCRSLL